MNLYTSGIQYDSATTEFAKQLGLSYAPTVTVPQDEPIEQMTLERLKQIAAWCDPGPDYSGPLCIDTEGKLLYDLHGYTLDDKHVGIGPAMDRAETKLIKFDNLAEKLWSKATTFFYSPFHTDYYNRTSRPDLHAKNAMVAGMSDRLVVSCKGMGANCYAVHGTDIEANRHHLTNVLENYLDMALVRSPKIVKPVYAYVSYRSFFRPEGEPRYAPILPEVFRDICQHSQTVTDRYGRNTHIAGLILWDNGMEVLQWPGVFGPTSPTLDQLNATHQQYLNVFAGKTELTTA